MRPMDAFRDMLFSYWAAGVFAAYETGREAYDGPEWSYAWAYSDRFGREVTQ